MSRKDKLEQRRGWNWGISDYQLGKQHNLHYASVKATRRNLGLPPHQRKYRARVPLIRGNLVHGPASDKPLPKEASKIPLVSGRAAKPTGLFAAVDTVDFERASEFKWRTNQSKEILYVYRYAGKNARGKSTFQYLHHFITGLNTSHVVDHKDGNGLNNCRDNLRPCSDAQNASNRKVHYNNPTGFKGVCWHSRDEIFIAKISPLGKQISLGVFTDPEEAARAYDKAAVLYFGEFAKLNFPPNE